jgi:cob(I)alamin adenosyltransferase
VAFFNEELPPLKEFILPGGHPWSAGTHYARTVCRRVERKLVGLYREEPGPPATLQYLNRLSDVLFVLARWLNKASHTPEVLWQPRKKPEA